MGTLSDYFLATTAELNVVATTGAIPAAFAQVEAKGFDVVAINALSKLLAAGGEGVDPGDPIFHSEGYEWFVLKVTRRLVDALATMRDADITRKGAAVAAIAELGWPAKDGQSIVRQLRELAQKAHSTKKKMYLWSST